VLYYNTSPVIYRSLTQFSYNQEKNVIIIADHSMKGGGICGSTQKNVVSPQGDGLTKDQRILKEQKEAIQSLGLNDPEVEGFALKKIQKKEEE